MILLICGILKKGTNELIYKTNRVTYVENKLMVTGGKQGTGEGIRWMTGIEINTLLYIK